MSIIFAPAFDLVNSTLAPAAEWSDLIDAQYAAHLDQEAEDARWDALASEAAEEAAYDRACEVGYGNW